MSSTGDDYSLNLEKDVDRAIVLLDRLRTTSEIPEGKLTELQRIFQSDFFRAVLEVYEKIYDTVEVSGSPEVRANATAKATVSKQQLMLLNGKPIERNHSSYCNCVLGGRFCCERRSFTSTID